MEAGDNNKSQYKPLQCALGRFDGTKSPQKPSPRRQFLKANCWLSDWFVDCPSCWPSQGNGEVSLGQLWRLIKGKAAKISYLAELVETLFLELGMHMDLDGTRESCWLVLSTLAATVCSLWPHMTWTGAHSSIFPITLTSTSPLFRGQGFFILAYGKRKKQTNKQSRIHSRSLSILSVTGSWVGMKV